MPDDATDIEGLDDFAGAMQILASQAAAKSSAGGTSARNDRSDILLAVGQMIRPLAKELEDLRHKNAEQSLLLTALGKSLNAQGSVGPTLESMREQMLRIGSVESANQKLFDALHAELKGYKDNFLFDALQKPFVRDLVSLYDDLNEVHAGMLRRLETVSPKGPGEEGKDREETRDDKDGRTDEAGYLKMAAGNVENQIHHMIEVFLRMDVTISQTRPGAPLDKKAHRVVGFEPATLPAEDNLIFRSVKPGFLWRDRLIRAEEVMVRRWTAPLTSHAAAPRVTALIANPVVPPATGLMSTLEEDVPAPTNASSAAR